MIPDRKVGDLNIRMLHLFLVFAAVLVPLLSGGGYVARSAAQDQQPTLQVGEWTLSSVVDWQSGQDIPGILITNNAGGELRLEDTLSEGLFLSSPFETPFPIHAAGAVWRAEIPSGTDVSLELRGASRPDEELLETQPEEAPAEELLEVQPEAAPAEIAWGEWQPLIAGDARSQANDGAFATPNVVTFPPDTGYLQIRVRLSSEVERASAVLTEVTIAYLNAQAGPPTPRGLQRAPIIFGPETLTPRPTLIPRATWFTGGEVSVNGWAGTPPTQVLTDTWTPGLPPNRPERVSPRGIIIYQINATTDETATLPLLRALGTYQIRTLGWDDLAYHYLIDQAGNLYEGRLGGPTSAVSRLSGSDNAIHVAMIGNSADAPAEEAQAALVSLLAWLGQAYDIPPTGDHVVVVQDQLQTRPNIAGHYEAAPEAPDPGEPFREILPQIRERADQSTVRARWYFAEGNVEAYTQQLFFFNPTDNEANANVTLWNDTDAAPTLQIVAVPASGLASLTLNDIVSGTATLPAVVESSAPILTERRMYLPTDSDITMGIGPPSRVWYFAEGSTDDSFNTYLVLFNPQISATLATITFMKGDGSVSTMEVPLPASQRVVVTVGNELPGVGFGMQVVTNQPIIAERTMRFGSDTSGFHTGPGINRLSQSWYFAEGTTAPPFKMRLLLLNPNQQTANVTATFMTPDGTQLDRRYAVPPTTRLVVDVNEIVPTLGIATMVESDRPIAVERSLYFAENEDSLDPTAGTVSAGAATPAFTWHFIDGADTDARQYLLLGNPNRRQASVTVEFILPDGSTETQSVTMPASSRYTMAVHEIYPDQDFSAITVRATQPVVAERSIFPANGSGSTHLGMPQR